MFKYKSKIFLFVENYVINNLIVLYVIFISYSLDNNKIVEVQ